MKVSELLRGATNVVTVREDDHLALAGQMMVWAGIRHLPVVRDDRVVGVVSETDILRHQAIHGARALGQDRVHTVVARPAEVIGPEDEISEASARMLTRHLGCLPVVDGERLVGIVTRSDVLAAVASGRTPTADRSQQAVVADVMTRAPRTARPEERLLEAIVRMSRAGVRHLPVVDSELRVLGMLSDRDVRDAIGRPEDAFAAHQPATDEAALVRVGDVMTSPAMTVDQNEALHEVTGDFIDQRVSAFPVVDDQHHLVGMLSYIDVLGAVYRGGADTARGPIPEAAPAGQC